MKWGDPGGTVVDQALDATIQDPGAHKETLKRGASLGRYLVLDVLGSGGMGVVYSAYDPELDRKVAVKLLRSVEGDGSSGRTRLMREAQSMARLADPNVIQVFDVGTVDDQVFVAMELVDGVTLRKWAEGRSSGEILSMYLQAARGLQAAHAAGLIHRDFKPDNALVGADGRARVLDFGLARVAQDAPTDESRRATNLTALTTPLTRTGAFLGTPAYMAPEQLAGDPVDAKCDQFAFGVALYEALYGERPFGGETLDQLVENIRAHQVREAPAGKNVNSTVRSALVRALSPDREARFPSMAALIDEIRPAAPSRTAARVVAVAFALIAVMVIAGWWQSRRNTATRVQRAQELGQQVQKIRSAMRAAHLMPLHDTKPDKDRVRDTIRRIEAQLAELGAEGRGPAEFAIGTGWLSLGDNDAAQTHLQAAWAAGDRDPDLAYELGVVLVKQYRRALRATAPLPDDKMKARNEELDRTLRSPAIQYLRMAGGATDTSPAYIEALIAYAEHRWDDARERGEAAFRDAPTRYESGLLVASVDAQLAHVAEAKGDAALAEAKLALAEAMFAQLVEIGRSDYEIYQIYVDHLATHISQKAERGEDVSAMFAQALQLCEQARRADSEEESPDVLRARLHWAMGMVEDRRHHDPRPEYRLAIDAAEELLQRNPRSGLALLYLGNAWGSMGDWELPHGLDPRVSMQTSIDALTAMLAIAPDENGYANLGSTQAQLALWQMAHGLDATATVEAAIGSFRNASKLDPDTEDPQEVNACHLLADFARDRLEHGQDPKALLARAEALCGEGLRRRSGIPNTLSVAAISKDVAARRAALTGGDPSPLWAQAEAYLADSLKIDPQYLPSLTVLPTVRAARAEYRRDTKELARARAEAQRAIQIDPASNDAQRALARVALAAGRLGIERDPSLVEGERAAARALAIMGNDLAAMQIAVELRLVAVRAGQSAAIREAESILKSALAMNPNHPRLLLLGAAVARASGNAAKADADSAAALAAGPLLENDPVTSLARAPSK